MKKTVIELFEKRIEVLYQESRAMLLKASSYTVTNIQFKNVNLFLTFLESALEKPYNRLCALSVFLNDGEHFRTNLMYPFALLAQDVKEAISEKESEGIKLANALDVGEIDENYVVLWKEKQLLKGHIK